MEQYSSKLDHFYKWTHLVPDRKTDPDWICQVPYKRKAFAYEMNSLVRLRLHEVSTVQFHLDWIHFSTGSPELCWVYMGTIPPWNSSSKLDHFHTWTHLVPDKKTDLDWICHVLYKRKTYPHQMNSIVKLHEISAVQFHLDWIHSSTGSPERCWVYMGTIPPWNSTVPNWITFISGFIWYRTKEPI